jgi:hypothetical protein
VRGLQSRFLSEGGVFVEEKVGKGEERTTITTASSLSTLLGTVEEAGREQGVEREPVEWDMGKVIKLSRTSECAPTPRRLSLDVVLLFLS